MLLSGHGKSQVLGDNGRMARIPIAPANGPQFLAGRVLSQLRRHPFAMRAHFDQSLVITWAFAPEVLKTFLVEGLALDTFTDADGVEWGFAAVSVVKLRQLRPAFAPLPIGASDVMAGYRVFCTMQTPAGDDQDGGKTMRGLRIVASRTTNLALQVGANASTRYGYGRMRSTITQEGNRLRVDLTTADGAADLTATAQLDDATLPSESVFANAAQARRFAGPLPYTFSPDPEGIVVVKADRNRWEPRPVAVEVEQATFFDHDPFAGAERRLSNAFHVADVDYGWQPGQLYRFGGSKAPWSTVTVR